MIPLALLLALAFSGCERARDRSLSSVYEEVQKLIRSEQDQLAWERTEQALQRMKPDSAWYPKFRLLRVEILLARREGEQAGAALDFQIPSGSEWNRERARYRFYQGYAAYWRRDYDAAEACLRDAEKLARSAEDPLLVAGIELRQGTLAVAREEFQDAAGKFRRVLDYATRSNDKYLEMMATGNTGHGFLESYHYDLAIPWFEKTIAHARDLNAAETEARAMGNLGLCYYRLGSFDKAIPYFEQAEARFAKAGRRQSRQVWLGHIGTIYRERRDYVHAGAIYQRALTIARDLGDRLWSAVWLNNLAEISIELKDWDAAERYNNESWDLKKKLNNRSAEIYSLTNAALIAAGRNEMARALELFQSVLASSSEDPTPLLDAHIGLALLRDAGKDPRAEAEFRATDTFIARRSSQLIKDEYKVTYFSRLIHFYQEYVEFLVTRNKPLAALEIAESSRARVLSSRLRLKRVRQPQQTTAGFQRVARAYGGTLLSYWLAPKRSYLWVVTGTAVTWFPLPPEPEIRGLVERYDSLIQNMRDPLTLDEPTGARLYQALIAPASPALGKSKKVIVTPDGPLFSLNFETIPVPGATPHYWIDDVTVSVAPSLGLLAGASAANKSASSSLLLIGNPVSSSEQYPPLQFAGQEMASIDKSSGARRKVILSGPQANAEAYSLADPGRFGLIHFVAHAVANRQEPLDSAVILSPHGKGDRLFAKDVIDTPLQAQLVTISACRGAGARIYAGEGLVGFSWAFLQAGARNVIAGLWDVSDRSTAEIMGHLYPDLARGATAAEALRAAKLDLIRSAEVYRKPYYWAPFQLFTSSPQ